MANFRIGQTVIYEGKETTVQAIYDDGTCKIANPYWDWDEEAMCVENDTIYDVPYWIVVDLSELSSI